MCFQKRWVNTSRARSIRRCSRCSPKVMTSVNFWIVWMCFMRNQIIWAVLWEHLVLFHFSATSVFVLPIGLTIILWHQILDAGHFIELVWLLASDPQFLALLLVPLMSAFIIQKLSYRCSMWVQKFLLFSIFPHNVLAHVPHFAICNFCLVYKLYCIHCWLVTTNIIYKNLDLAVLYID